MNRIVSVAGALALCTLGCPTTAASGLPPAPAKTSEDSVSYQLNTAHTGSINFAGGFSGSLTQAWAVNLGGPISYPITADGMVFVTVGENGSPLLFALDLATGAVKWVKLLNSAGGGWADATYDDGKVFVLTASGVLTAYRANSGRLLWSAQVPGGYSSNSVIYGAPVARDGLVIVQYEDSSSNDDVSAYDETSGTTTWTSAFGEFDGAFVQAPIDLAAAMGENGNFFNAPGFAQDAQFYALSPANGSTVWMVNSGPPKDPPVLAQDTVFVSGPNTILDSATGSVKGYFDGATAPVPQGKRLLVSLNGALYDYTPQSGNVRWFFAGDGSLDTDPIIVNGYVAAVSARGNLYLLDGSTGQQRWTTSLPNGNNFNFTGPDWGLGAGEGTLLVPFDGDLYAFVPSGGAKRQLR